MQCIRLIEERTGERKGQKNESLPCDHTNEEQIEHTGLSAFVKFRDLAIFHDSMHEVLPHHDLSKSLLSHRVSDSVKTTTANNISQRIRNRQGKRREITSNSDNRKWN